MRFGLGGLCMALACGSIAPPDDACQAPDAGAPLDFECASCTADAIYLSPGSLRNLAANDANVWVVEDDTGGGQLLRIPYGGRPTVVATGLVAPDDIALDRSRVYWTCGGSGTTPGSVMASPVDGDAPQTLATGGHPGAIALDACNLYWASDGELWTMPIAGGSPRVLATLRNFVDCIAVDATNVYVLESYGLETVPIAGGVSEYNGGTQGQSIVVFDGRAYGTFNHIDPFGAGWVGGLDGTPTAQTHGYATSLAVDAAHIWWLDWGLGGGVPGTVARLPIAGGAAQTVVQPASDAGASNSLTGPHSIALSPHAAYWIEGNAVRRLQ